MRHVLVRKRRVLDRKVRVAHRKDLVTLSKHDRSQRVFGRNR
jgi:hypothetical protein